VLIDSGYFIKRWLHNEFGCSTELWMRSAWHRRNHDRNTELFAYRLYPQVFRRGDRVPLAVPSEYCPIPFRRRFNPLASVA
jgi:hypothetical protein